MAETMPQPEAMTFEENPVEYCKQIYAEAKRRNEDLRDINIANRKFYEGEDSELEKRKNDPDVVRSGLFIHELKPAIDTRVSDVVSKLEEREFPITIRPAAVNPSSELKEQAAMIEVKLNEQLRDCGYLSDGFKDHITASEIYRSPATVKVSWEQTYGKEPIVKVPGMGEMLRGVSQGRMPRPRVVFVDKHTDGAPHVELLPPDEFLYEPDVSHFQNDSTYAGHAVWVSWQRLMSLAVERGWDIEKIKRYKEEVKVTDQEGGNNETFEHAVQDETDEPFTEGYRDGQVLVTEFYVKTYDHAGSEVINHVVMVGNKFQVEKGLADAKGIKFPFVLSVANRFPGSVEGLSSVDIGMPMQRLYNELFNQFLDGTSYRTFPPLVQEPGTVFQEKPKWGPGQVWKISNPDGLRPLIDNPGPMPDLPALMEAVGAKLRHVLNAEDISQGFQSQEYEKATSTNLRAQGAAKRSLPTSKKYGEVLIEVAKMVLALNQQHAENGADFVVQGGIVIDVPSLTAVSDPETEKQEALLLLAQAAQSQLYQTPTGQFKLRNLMEDVVRSIKKVGVENYVVTKEELQSDLQAQAGLQQALLQKQQAQERLGIAAETASPQEGSGGQ